MSRPNSTRTPVTPARASSPSYWGVLSTLLLIVLTGAAFATGAYPTTWFYPGVVLVAVFALAYFLGLNVVTPPGATWQPVLALVGGIASLLILFTGTLLGVVWWVPVVGAHVLLTVVELVRRL